MFQLQKVPQVWSSFSPVGHGEPISAPWKHSEDKEVEKVSLFCPTANSKLDKDVWKKPTVDQSLATVDDRFVPVKLEKIKMEKTNLPQVPCWLESTE